MRKIYTVILALFAGAVMGQDSSAWSVQLPEAPVIVDSIRFDPFLLYALDESWVEASGAATLAEAIGLTGAIPIRSYGPSGTLVTGVSRSLSADHFNVEWNGVPIQSAALGLTDLSTIPIGLFDNSFLTASGRSTSSAYGSAGGSLVLGSSSDEEISLSSTYNDLNNLVVIGKARVDIGKGWFSDTRYQRNRSRNEFTFEDPYLLQDRISVQEHNDHHLDALMQRFEGHIGSKLKVNTALWVQRSYLEIPEILGSLGESFAQQSDSSLRLSAGLDYQDGPWRQSLKIAWMETRQNYRDKHAQDQDWLINSNINETRKFLRYNLTFTNRSFRIQGGYEVMPEQVRSDAFQNDLGERWIHGPQLSASFEKGRIEARASGRMDFGLPETIPIGSFRFFYSLKKHKLFAEAERIFRYPDMNELFWEPGGNINLKPEKGFALRGGSRFRWDNIKSYHELEVLVYHQRMHDLILWRPGEGFWFASNTDSVNSIGIDVRYRAAHSVGKIVLRNTLQLQFQQNNIQEEVLQAFFPELQGRWSSEAIWKRWKLGAQGRFVSNELMPEAMNSGQAGQDAVALADVFVGYHFDKEKWHFSLTLMTQNIGNTLDHRLANTASPQRIIALTFNTHWK